MVWMRQKAIYFSVRWHFFLLSEFHYILISNLYRNKSRESAASVCAGRNSAVFFLLVFGGVNKQTEICLNKSRKWSMIYRCDSHRDSNTTQLLVGWWWWRWVFALVWWKCMAVSELECFIELGSQRSPTAACLQARDYTSLCLRTLCFFVSIQWTLFFVWAA